jgi:hypothetical protein
VMNCDKGTYAVLGSLLNLQRRNIGELSFDELAGQLVQLMELWRPLQQFFERDDQRELRRACERLGTFRGLPVDACWMQPGGEAEDAALPRVA